jgi:hypothetical protein
MWPLTLEGLGEAVRYLVRGGKPPLMEAHNVMGWMR